MTEGPSPGWEMVSSQSGALPVKGTVGCAKGVNSFLIGDGKYLEGFGGGRRESNLTFRSLTGDSRGTIVDGLMSVQETS